MENNHVLVPASYSIEWYRAELRRAAGTLPEGWSDPPDLEAAVAISKKNNVPLHPKFNLFWSDVTLDSLKQLRSDLLTKGRMQDGSLLLDDFQASKLTLENLGALHSVKGGELVISFHAYSLLAGLGLLAGSPIAEERPFEGSDSIEAVSSAMGIKSGRGR